MRSRPAPRPARRTGQPQVHTSILLIALAVAAPGILRAQTPADSAGRLAEAAMTAYQQGTRIGREQALQLFNAAAAQFRLASRAADAAEMEASVAALHNALGRPDSALHYYARAVSHLADAASLAYVLRQYGEVFHGMGQLDSALVRYRRSLQLAREVGNGSDEATTLNNIGAALNTLGRPDSASRYLHEALVIRRSLDEAQGEGVTLNNIAVMHQGIGRPDSALVFLKESLAARRRAGDVAGEGTTLNNIGFSFELMDEPDSAIAYYRVALDVLESAGRRSTYGVTLGNMGRVFLSLSQPDSARHYLVEGLAVKREVNDLRGLAWMLNDLGRMHAAAQRSDSAGDYFARALTALRDVGERAREGNTLYQIARFHHRTAGVQDLRTAIAYYDSAAAVRAEVGRRTLGDADRVAFIEQDVRLYAEWTLAWLARSDELGEGRAAAAALAAAERGRAQALLDLMRTRDADGGPPPGRPGTDLIAEGEGLAAAAANNGGATIQYLSGADTLIVWLIDRGGRITAERVGIGSDSIALLVAAWREGTAEGEAIPALVDRGAGIGIRRRARIPADSAAVLLREALLPPRVRRQIPASGELIVVPHGALNLLSFAALPADERGGAFTVRHAIRYAPSLATLVEVEARPRAAVGSLADAIIFGNPSMPDAGSVRLSALPGAEREAAAIARRLDARTFSGAAASEALLRERAARAPLIHLATHGFAYSSDARTRDSFVALAAGQGHDGFLTVAEILEDLPSLTADLIVLSACQTGLGDLKHAEGTIGLQRAFLARGAASVLVSLWNVSDTATAALMDAFYRHWQGGRTGVTKAEALRRAQNEVRSMEGFEHPRYWAAFQLVGAR